LAGTLPFIAFLSLWLAIGNAAERLRWRRAYLRATLIWGAYAVALTEGLSLFKAVAPTTLLVGWGAVAVAASGTLVTRRLRGGGLALPRISLPPELGSRLALLVTAMVLAATSAVAWQAPPNTWDSLNYHMSRVAHWAQDRGLRHYATGIEVQNSMPPGAELLVFNLYVLSGGDRLANFIQWFAMVGSLIGVSVLAGQLGAARLGQWTAVVFAATLPMGVIQASSTMTDYMVGLWVLAAASEAISIWRDHGSTIAASASFGLAAGLSVLTKPTAYAFLTPLALLAIIGLVRARRVAPLTAGLLLMAGLSLALNAGHLSRNIRTYHNPIASTGRIEEHRNAFLAGRGLLSNLLRNAGLHAGTPSPHFNKAMALVVLGIHDLIGLDVNDPRTTATGSFKISTPTTNENRAGNPLQAWLSLPCLIILFVRPQPRMIRWYGLAVLSSFVLFSLLFQWQSFGSRYHLPFFLLLSPLVATLLERAASPALLTGLIGVMFVASWPWLFGIDSRPLLSKRAEGGLGSIYTIPREQLYFANAPYLERPFTEMADLIRDGGCPEVGISFAGGGIEYPLWPLLGAPDPDLRVEWVVSGTASEIYRDPAFRPCAVVCQHCQAEASVSDLPLTYERSEFRLFMNTED
jgi:hypothetical protein